MGNPAKQPRSPHTRLGLPEVQGQDGTTERLLIEAIEPIRFFALAAVLHGFLNSELFSLLSGPVSVTPEHIAATLNLDAWRLRGLWYLRNEGYVAKTHRLPGRTAKAQRAAQFHAWYVLLIGGYGRTFLDLAAHLPEGSPWAPRDTHLVGIGSCGISRYDAIPLTIRLHGTRQPLLSPGLDLGCGNAQYIVDLCERLPRDLLRFGVEPDATAAEAAREPIRLCESLIASPSITTPPSSFSSRPLT